MIRLNGYGSFNFSNGRKQANLLDTSFLHFPGLGPSDVFYHRAIPPEGMDSVIKDISIHFAHIREAIAKKEVCILDCVLEEITALDGCINSWRRHLINSYAPAVFRHGLNEFNNEYRRLMQDIRTQSNLDPRHRFTSDDARDYSFLLGKVRENSKDLYDPIKTQKIHSERGKRLETDRHLAAMMLFYNKDRDVKLFGNDRDVAKICQTTGDALLAEGMRPSIFSIYTIRCPRPDQPYVVGEIILQKKMPPQTVPQRNIAKIIAA